MGVNILKRKVLGRLDSGATNTAVGTPGWDILKERTISNGMRNLVLAYVIVSIKLIYTVKPTDVLVVFGYTDGFDPKVIFG